jgi:hypothetical protein
LDVEDVADACVSGEKFLGCVRALKALHFVLRSLDCLWQGSVFGSPTFVVGRELLGRRPAGRRHKLAEAWLRPTRVTNWLLFQQSHLAQTCGVIVPVRDKLDWEDEFANRFIG